MATDPDRELEHTTEEFDERLEKLGEHIENAEKKAPDATLGDDGANLSGDWEDTDDATGGEDPDGAAKRD